MFDTNTQYALNKRNANAIVYVDAFGEKTEISPEALGEASFAQWKALIDNDLHEEEKADHIYHDHIIPIGDLGLEGYAVPDHETFLIEEEERRERAELRTQAGIAFFTCLTDIQQERMWMFAIEGMTLRQIAAVEGVSHQKINTSIYKARKNILTFLQKGGCQMPVFAAYSERTIH